MVSDSEAGKEVSAILEDLDRQPNPQSVFEVLLRRGRRLLDAQTGAVFLDGGRGAWKPTLVEQREDSNATPGFSQTIVQSVRLTRKPTISADAILEGRWASSESICLWGIRGVIAAPIFLASEVIAVVVFDSRERAHWFDDRQLALLVQLADRGSRRLDALGV